MSRFPLFGFTAIVLLCACYWFSRSSEHISQTDHSVVETVLVQKSPHYAFVSSSVTSTLSPPSSATDRPARPIVHRSVLEKLDALDNEYQAPFFRTRPLVDRLPEAHKTKRVDCITGGRRCQFILPIRIAEQESKARIHFLQLLQLAIELDRVLVLPHVDSSRLGACLKQDFQTYYDVNRLQTLYGENIISLNDFKRWTRKQAVRPISRLISLHSNWPITSDNATLTLDGIHVVLEKEPDYSKLPSCMNARFPRLQLESPALLVNPVNNGHEYDPPISDSLVSILSGNYKPLQSFSESDVLVVNWNFRHAVFPPFVDQLPMALGYSPALHAAASKLLPSESYIAVHWRMETVSPMDLPRCAELLIDTVARIAEDDGSLASVWFATDFPYSLEGGAAQNKSQTFKEFSPQHTIAVHTFRSSFEPGGRLAKLKLAGLAEITESATFAQDSGARGIIDKLVAIEADILVSGGRGCSRQQSSYTKQIVDARVEKGVFTAWETFDEEMPPVLIVQN